MIKGVATTGYWSYVCFFGSIVKTCLKFPVSNLELKKTVSS